MKRWFRLTGRHQLRRDIDEEIELHIELRAGQLMDEGLDADRARREATRRFFTNPHGGKQQLYRTAQRRQARMERTTLLAGWIFDARQAIRGLQREPRFLFLVVAVLAVGIGTTSAMYGVVDRLLVSGPPHLENPDQLSRLNLSYRSSDGSQRVATWLRYEHYLRVTDSLPSVQATAAFAVRDEVVGTGSETLMLRVGGVSERFFDVLGTTALRGRLFGVSSDPWPEPPVAVISYGFWQRRMGGDPDALGRSIAARGRSFTIVGVARPGFTGPTFEPVDVWLPIEQSMAPNRNWQVIVRAAPEVSRESLGAVATAHNRATYTGSSSAWREGSIVATSPLDDAQGQELPEAKIARLLILMTGFLLFISSVNVANLLLARSVKRQRELSVRVALGAGRWRLARLLLSESLVLSLLAGIAALPVAYVFGGGVRSILTSMTFDTPPVDSTVFVGALLLSLAVGTATGLLPAIRVRGETLMVALRSGAWPGQARSRMRTGLMSAQMLLSVPLLIGAGLFLRSLVTIRSVDLGMDADRAIYAILNGENSDVLGDGTTAEGQAYEAALDAVSALPQVEAAAVAVGIPFASAFGMSIAVPGVDPLPDLPGGFPRVSQISPQYFAALGIPVIRGRAFRQVDLAGGRGSVIINRTAADRLWPGEDPLGRCIVIEDAGPDCSSVLGVVANTHTAGYDEGEAVQLYFPLGSLDMFSGSAMVIRPVGNPRDSWATIRRTLIDSDPRIVQVEMTSLESLLAAEVRPWRLGASALTVCALLALIVAALGVYSVTSYIVSQRSKEYGLRIALGATRSRISATVVGGALKSAAVGVGLGVVVALVAAPRVEPLLFETSGRDPLVFIAVVAWLVITTLLSCVAPARRAANSDPMSALASE